MTKKSDINDFESSYIYLTIFKLSTYTSWISNVISRYTLFIFIWNVPDKRRLLIYFLQTLSSEPFRIEDKILEYKMKLLTQISENSENKNIHTGDINDINAFPHEKRTLRVCAGREDTDQPARPRRLICVYAARMYNPWNLYHMSGNSQGPGLTAHTYVWVIMVIGVRTWPKIKGIFWWTD